MKKQAQRTIAHQSIALGSLETPTPRRVDAVTVVIYAVFAVPVMEVVDAVVPAQLVVVSAGSCAGGRFLAG